MVYKVHVNETHEDFAMKVYSKQAISSMRDTLVKDLTTGKMKVKNYLDDIKREIQIMKRLSSLNVVRL